MASVISERYALSLYEVAKAENLDLFAPLQAMADIFAENPEYLKILSTPSIGLEQKKTVITAVFQDRIHVYLLNFLMLLTEKQRIGKFAEIVHAYKDMYYLEEGICEVTAVTAIALDADQIERLKEKMMTVTGKKIVLHNQVDPKVLGGVLVRIENKQIDDTIQTRLNDLTVQLTKIIA